MIEKQDFWNKSYYCKKNQKIHKKYQGYVSGEVCSSMYPLEGHRRTKNCLLRHIENTQRLIVKNLKFLIHTETV